MKPVPAAPRILVALDFPRLDAALALLDQLAPDQCRLKIGKEMFTRYGPAVVEEAMSRGFDVFLDLKFHDIPNTAAAACAAAAELGVWMLNVHASGGGAMLRTARERLDKLSKRPLLIGVTLLTSMAQDDLDELGWIGKPDERVLRLARLVYEAGLDGVVCSAREAGLLREELPEDFLLVTPGIRPAGSAMNDQRRITTPASALADGADYLVVGRPITAAADPCAALESIRQEIGEV